MESMTTTHTVVPMASVARAWVRCGQASLGAVRHADGGETYGGGDGVWWKW